MTTTTLPVRATAPDGPSRPGSPDLDRRPVGSPLDHATPRSSAPPTTAPRTDIQALRALAVTLVLVYHLWPNRLTGGFVGVDVFFVLSGFLITAHLLNRPPRSLRDFAGFWARRIRRLLPAALLVLGATLLASRLLAPETQWANIARQVGAATLYVENWLLAGDSVDYLAAANAPTPVQHFWSLSVEEQFYLVWPLLIALLAVIALRRNRKGRRRPRAVLAGLGVVVLGSLAASIVLTLSSPADAYFVTPTRAWEFGLGGLLAALVAYQAKRSPAPGRVRLTSLARVLLALLGLAGISYAAFAFNASTPFPGYWALIPTLGTIAVLAAMPTAEVGPFGRALALRPVQWLGDVSYSVYLWHWPLIVLVPFVIGGRLSLVDKLAIIVVTVVLAGLTKRFVEDRYRQAPLGTGPARAFVAAAVGMALVLTLAAVQLSEVQQRTAGAQQELINTAASKNPCLGAGSLRNPEQCAGATFDSIVPAPASATDDKAAVYQDVPGGRDCISNPPKFSVIRCTFGDPSAKRQLALVGNSHAAQWLPALQELAQERGWGITTYIASRCAMVPTNQNMFTSAQSQACRSWGDKVSAEIKKSDYDLVVLSNRMSMGVLGSKSAEQSYAGYQRGYEKLLEDWSKAGVKTLAIRDTPAPGDVGLLSIPDCVAEHPGDLNRCSGTPQDWIPAEPLEDAMAAVKPTGIQLADFNNLICGPRTCQPVVGGVLVYYDGSHLTGTYARTLAPSLGERIRNAIRQS